MSDVDLKGLEALRAKFPAEQIGKLPKPTKRNADKGNCRQCGGYHGLPAVHLDYVGHAAVTDRLRQVDPTWYWEPFAIDADGGPLIRENNGTAVMWGRLTVCGVTRIGVGTCDAGKAERDKELIGDFLRNAAMRFGVALDLWSKEELDAAGIGTAPVAEPEAPPLPTSPDPNGSTPEPFPEGPPLRPPAPEPEIVQASDEDKAKVQAVIDNLPGTWKADIQRAWREAKIPSVKGKLFTPDHVQPALNLLAGFEARWKLIQRANILARETLDGDTEAADAVISFGTNARTTSLRECELDDLGVVIDTLEKIKDGRLELKATTDGKGWKIDTPKGAKR